MEIHKPKPWHGVREFLGEILIIVIGVLIALGAEQVAERIHLERQARENEAAFRADLGRDARFAAERLMVSGCTTDRIRHLSAKLQAGGPWSADPQTYSDPTLGTTGAMPDALHEPSRVWVRSSWDTAVHSEAIRLLPDEKRADFASMFDQIGRMAEAQDAESRAEAQLIPLSYNLTLTPELRAQFLIRLGEVDEQHREARIIAVQLLDAARELGVSPDPKTLGQIYDGQSRYRGDCVKPLKE